MVSPETVPCVLASKVLAKGKYRYAGDIYTVFKVNHTESNHSDGTPRVDYYYLLNDESETLVFNEYNSHFIDNAVLVEHLE